MADFVLVNASATARNNVNAGGDDVAAYTTVDGITMTNAELLTFSGHADCFALGESAGFDITDGESLSVAYLKLTADRAAQGDGTADGSVINDAGDPGL